MPADCDPGTPRIAVLNPQIHIREYHSRLYRNMDARRIGKPSLGSAIEQEVAWTGGKSLRELGGKPVLVLFELYDADLFGFRFAK